MKILKVYNNGNYKVLLFDDGTKIRKTNEDKFISSFPECIDLKITNKCDMGCKYCFPKNTKILMEDYSLKNIEDIKIGDTIISFDEYPSYSETYTKRTIKKAMVKKLFFNKSNLLEIKTEKSAIKCSPNHPFLVPSHGKEQKQYDYKLAEKLKIGDKIYKIPYFDNNIEYENDDYKKGYILSSFLGDGTVKHYIDKKGYDAYNCRFVVNDEEISERLLNYLSLYNDYFYYLPFKAESDIGKMNAISVRSNKKDAYEYINSLKSELFNVAETKEYASGFLSGIYDSEGSIYKTVIRIHNCELDIIKETERCLKILNISFVRETGKNGTKNYDYKYSVRVKESNSWIKFIQLTKPACKRKGIENIYNKSLLYSEKITDIKVSNDVEDVYNFETTTHTYFANNIAVHNCHEDSTIDGLHGDVLNTEFINTLKPYTELALGGGNVLTHPNLIEFLKVLKSKNIIANITVNQKHFIDNIDTIKHIVDNDLIKGLGVSLLTPTDEFIELIEQFPNAVIHVINGIVTLKDLQKLYDNNLKLLILGYKVFRRGKDYYSITVESNKQVMNDNILEILKRFKVVSFDNLAIKQLNMQDKMSQKEWNEFYMGDDGQFTMYIDLVKRQFARSSISTQRYDLQNNIEDMFDIIKNEK